MILLKVILTLITLLIRPREDRDINNDGVYGDLIYGAAGNEVIQFPDVDLRGRIVDLIRYIH